MTRTTYHTPSAKWRLNNILVTAMAVLAMTISSSTVAIGIGIEGSVKGIPLPSWQEQAQYTQLSGHNIAYWQAGNPKNDTLVLVHGFPSAAWDWQYQWQALSKKYHVVALDLLGFGLSDKPKEYAYTINEQADLVTGLAKQLNIKQYHLLSHDYGITVTQEILRRHNKSELTGKGFLLSLCILNGGAFPEAQKHPIGMRLLNSFLGPYLVKLYNRTSFDRNFSAIFGENTQPTNEQLDGLWQLILQQDGPNAFPNIIHYVNEKDQYRDTWVGAMENASIPMRAIIGTADVLAGENMLERYEALIKNPDVVRLKDIGHYPQLEAPQAVLTAYLKFLSSIGNAKKLAIAQSNQ